MNTQIKQQWIQALKSSHYQQTTTYLRTEEGYCCLGVLCDLYAKEHDDVEWDKDGEDDDYEFLSEIQTLPIEVMKWAGLSDRDPYYVVPEDIETGKMNICLSAMNDNGTSFEKIAQVIEEKF